MCGPRATTLYLILSSLFYKMATIRPRISKVPFEIHHDEMEESMEEHQEMESSRIEDGDEVDGDDYSETSEESDGTIDAAVREDMDKFQESFVGIKERFRLIKRIGEGR